MKSPLSSARVRRVLMGVILVAALAAGVTFFVRMRAAQAAENLPTVPARKGEFLVIVRSRGELAARRSVQVLAPTNVPDLRIVWQVPSGNAVTAGEEVIKYDPSSARQQLQEKEAALRQAQATLDQALAQARTTSEQDKRDLAEMSYSVERAKLEVSKAEIVSRLQAEESRVDLDLAQSKMRVQQATGGLHEASDAAKIASLTRARDEAQAQVDLTKDRISRMVTRTPSSGIIIYLPNYSQGWVNAKPYKVGDQVYPGVTVAQVPDLNSLELDGKIEEIDRGRIHEGMEVRIKIDSLPELNLPGKLDRISPLTQMTFDWPPASNFRGYARIEKIDPRLRPGMNGAMDIVVKRIPNAISVPAKALFTRNGRPVVYLEQNGHYLPYEVKIVARNPDEIAVEGIPAGANVATVEPGAAPAATPGGEGKKQ